MSGSGTGRVVTGTLLEEMSLSTSFPSQWVFYHIGEAYQPLLDSQGLLLEIPKAMGSGLLGDKGQNR